MKITELSVFFPAYNEEKNIKNTVERALIVLKNLPLKKYEVIIVDDGSKDKTAEIADNLAKKNESTHDPTVGVFSRKNDKEVRVIHKQNGGYGSALQAGFYHARYNWITFTDSDGQFDFSEITKFIDKQKQTGADLVIGYYLDRKVGTFTKFTSKIWELVVYILFGLKAKDIDCGFKLISKEVIDKIPHLQSERGAFITSELLIKAQKKGFKFAEVGVSHFERLEGTATGRNLNVIVKSFINLFELWWKTT